MAEIKLDTPLPCPFCGCADIIASDVGEDESNWFVGCMDNACSVNPGVFCPDSEADAIALWNGRAAPIQQQAGAQGAGPLPEAFITCNSGPDIKPYVHVQTRTLDDAHRWFGAIQDLAALVEGPQPRDAEPVGYVSAINLDLLKSGHATNVWPGKNDFSKFPLYTSPPSPPSAREAIEALEAVEADVSDVGSAAYIHGDVLLKVRAALKGART